MQEREPLENSLNPEHPFEDFETFFGSRERTEICLKQVIDEVNPPQFIFHVTQQRSLETRRSVPTETHHFSFSTMASNALMMLSHRFLQRLRYPGFKMTDESVYQPVLVITDYQEIKTSPYFNEQPGLESGHEIEVGMSLGELSQNSLLIDSADRFKDLVDYFTQKTTDSEYKETAIRALNYKLEDWQEIERLRQEKTENY